MFPCVFLDRDGVIIENREAYIRSWEDVEFLPRVLPALAKLAASPCKVIIVTNQSVVGKGIITAPQNQMINDRINQVISAAGGRIDAVYTCPHRSEDSCFCRKPKPGLLMQAAREHSIDFNRSILIGDALSDVQAAQATGCKPLLVLTGRGEWQLSLIPSDIRSTLNIFQDLPEALNWYLSHSNAMTDSS